MKEDDCYDSKSKARYQFLITEQLRDFVEWLFDDPAMIDWMSQNEAWRRFHIHQWCQDKKQKP